MDFPEKYDILERVASGAAETYKARQNESGRGVLLHWFGLTPDPMAQFRLMKSALSYVLQDPGLGATAMVDSGDIQGASCLVSADTPYCRRLAEFLAAPPAAAAPAAPASAPREAAALPDAPVAEDVDTGEFERLFDEPPEGAQPPIAANPWQPEPSGEFTREFQAQAAPAVEAEPEAAPGGESWGFGRPLYAGAAPAPLAAVPESFPAEGRPAPSAPVPVEEAPPAAGPQEPAASGHGEFTRMFEAPSFAPPVREAAAPSPGPAPAQYTQVFKVEAGGAKTEVPLTRSPGLAQQPAEEQEPVGSVPAPPPPPVPKGGGEFTSFFQAPPPSGYQPVPLAPAGAMPPPAAPPQAAPQGGGDFTSFFQAPPPSAYQPAPAAPAGAMPPPTAPPQAAPQGGGEFTSFFQSPPPSGYQPLQASPSAAPASAAPGGGEFTRMFQAPDWGAGQPVPPPPTPGAPPMRAPSGPGDFTSIFGAPSQPAAPPAPGARQEGEYTRLFGSVKSAPPQQQPAWNAPPAAAGPGSGATGVFQNPPAGQQPSYVFEDGPSDFTRVLKNAPAAGQPVFAPPPAAAAQQPAQAPLPPARARSAVSPLLVVCIVVGVLAVVLILIVLLRR